MVIVISADTTESVHRRASSTGTIQKPPRHRTTIMLRCVVNRAKDQPLTSHQSFQRGDPSCRHYPAAQLAGVMRDGQRLSGVQPVA